MRYLFVCAALMVFAGVAFADGEYQRTRDGKTTVWNNAPKPGDEAVWWGDRDREGFATGFGTLTWYTGRKQTVKRLGILPVTTSDVYARYFGNMIRGKFNGPVNVHTDGKTAHAVFIDGVRADRWASGRAPSRRLPRAQVAKQEAASSKRSDATEPAFAKGSGVVEPEAPAEGPVQKPEIVRSQKEKVSEPRPQSPDRAVSESATDKKSQAEADESLFSLVGPPSSLRTNPDANASSVGAKPETALASGDARLTKEAVVDLADAEVHTRGYNPAEYERAEPQYNSADKVWLINYEKKPSLDETTESVQRFSVTIDDKTKGIVFVTGK